MENPASVQSMRVETIAKRQEQIYKMIESLQDQIVAIGALVQGGKNIMDPPPLPSDDKKGSVVPLVPSVCTSVKRTLPTPCPSVVPKTPMKLSTPGPAIIQTPARPIIPPTPVAPKVPATPVVVPVADEAIPSTPAIAQPVPLTPVVEAAPSIAQPVPPTPIVEVVSKKEAHCPVCGSKYSGNQSLLNQF
jgi:hypothetical protein